MFQLQLKKKRNRTPFREICSQRFTLRQIETHRGLNSTASQVLNGCGSVGNSLTFSQKFLGLGAHDLMWMISALEFLCSNFCLRFSQNDVYVYISNFFFFCLGWYISKRFTMCCVLFVLRMACFVYLKDFLHISCWCYRLNSCSLYFIFNVFMQRKFWGRIHCLSQ